MVKKIKFASGGKCGDFIHQLNVIRVICAREGAVADLFIVDDGDAWNFGAKQAHADMFDIIKEQWYINEFNCINGYPDGDFINLNDWRKTVATTHALTGKYDKCWSEVLSQQYEYRIPGTYEWMIGSVFDFNTKGKTVVHRSKHRHNSGFNWPYFMSQFECLFVTCDKQEWEEFTHKDKCTLYLVPDITAMVNAIWSADGFIGNQSAPFAIACALDKPRLCELDYDPAPFYIGEEKYSENIKWFLNDKINNL